VIAEAGPDRVQDDIAANLEQVGLVLDQDRAEAGLEDVSLAPVPLVEVTGVAPFSCRIPSEMFASGVSTTRW